MHLTWQPRPQGAFPWTRLVTPGLVEEKFESRFHHPCSNQLNITISTTDNQSIVTENRIYEIMEFSLKDKKPGKKNQQSKSNWHRVRYVCVMFYFIGNRGPFLIDLIKVLAFQSTPALHTCLGLGLACLKNSKK